MPEKFEPYRDELAEKLKEIRNSDEENPEVARAKAKGYLDAKKETPEYEEEKEAHTEEIQAKSYEHFLSLLETKEGCINCLTSDVKNKKLAKEFFTHLSELQDIGFFVSIGRKSGSFVDMIKKTLSDCESENEIAFYGRKKTHDLPKMRKTLYEMGERLDACSKGFKDYPQSLFSSIFKNVLKWSPQANTRGIDAMLEEQKENGAKQNQVREIIQKVLELESFSEQNSNSRLTMMHDFGHGSSDFTKFVDSFEK